MPLTTKPLTPQERNALIIRIGKGETDLLDKAKQHYTLTAEDENILYCCQEFKKIENENRSVWLDKGWYSKDCQ